MSYDFRLCMPRLGESPEETASADFQEFAAGVIDPEKEVKKRRMAEALIAENPSFAPFPFGLEEIAKIDQIPTEEAKKKYRHIELNGPEGGNGIQITLFDDEASVTVPYWHQGEKARRVFEEIWSYLSTLQRTGGYFTYDPRLNAF